MSLYMLLTHCMHALQMTTPNDQLSCRDSCPSPLWHAGINGAGKTTQLQIIAGNLSPDSGQVIKERANMKISYLTQEFDVEPTRTVRVRPASQLSCLCVKSK